MLPNDPFSTMLSIFECRDSLFGAMTFGTNETQHNGSQHDELHCIAELVAIHNSKGRYAECLIFIVMLGVILLSAIKLSTIMLSVILLSVILMIVIMLSVIMLSVILLSVIVLSVILMIAIMLCVIAEFYNA